MDATPEEGATATGNTGLWSLLAAASKYEDLEEADEDDDSVCYTCPYLCG